MLEAIVDRQVVFYFVGAAVAVGILAKLMAGISLKRLVKAASNMSKSDHSLMRLVRAKFEHACMVSDRVQNVGAFVDKYVYEYRVLGLRLHSLKRLERASVWLCALFAAVGAGLTYYVDGLGRNVYQYGIVGGAGVLILLIFHNLTDEQDQIRAARMYMVDFLENTYAHRYEKKNQKGFQVTVQRAPDSPQPEAVYANAAMPEVPYTDPNRQEMPQVNDPMVQPEKDMPVREPTPQPAPVPRHPSNGGVILQMEDGEDIPPDDYDYVRTREDMPSEEEYASQRNSSRRGGENGYARTSGDRAYGTNPYGANPYGAAPYAARELQYQSAGEDYPDNKDHQNRPPENRKERGKHRRTGEILRGRGQADPQVQPVSSGYVQAAGGYAHSGSGMENGKFAGQSPGGADDGIQDHPERQDVPKEARIREILEEFLT